MTAASKNYSSVLLEAWNQGVQDFNAGKYFEAHESWERGWKDLPQPERAWVQAWIQVAGVMCLLEKGRARAAHALSVLAISKLGRLGELDGLLPRVEIEGGREFLKKVESLAGRIEEADLQSAQRVLRAYLKQE